MISAVSVEKALDSLRYTTTNTSFAATLHALAIVDQFLDSPARPPAKTLREFAIQTILTDLITDALLRFRGKSNLPIPQPSNTRTEAISQIQLDSHEHSPEQIGWSFLYYHYIQIDLKISQADYSEFSHTEVRTLRRYKKHAIKTLTHRLIDLEWQAREIQHRQRLHAEIPGIDQQNLIGREAFVLQILQRLENNLQQRIYITGAKGIGKTALVRHLLYQLLESTNGIDYLLWFAEPQTIDAVYMTLRQKIMPPKAKIGLRTSLARHSVVVVIDDDTHLRDQRGWRELVDFLGLTTLFVTSRHYTPDDQMTFHLHLHDLSEQDVRDLVTVLYRQHYPAMQRQTVSSIANTIREHVGGNPLAVLLSTSRWINGYRDFDHTSLAMLYQKLFQSLDGPAQDLWVLCAVMKQIQVTVAHLDFWDAIIATFSESVNVLLKYFLLEQQTSPDCYQLAHSAKQFIKIRYANDIQMQSLIHKVANHLLKIVEHEAKRLRLYVAEALLLSDWPVLDSATQSRLIAQYASLGIEQLNYQIWSQIFNSASVDLPLDMQLAYGVCLRRLQHYPAANQLFQAIITSAGEQGDFVLQAYTRLEVAIMCRLLGNYAYASSILCSIQEIGERYQEDDLLGKIYLEHLQIAIDLGQAQAAHEYLQQVQTNTNLLLESEIALLQKRYAVCRDLAHTYLSSNQSTAHDQITAYTIIARSYQFEREYDHAIDWYNAVLSILEQELDEFATARARSNLASALLELGRYDEAEFLLKETAPIQQAIKDLPGWEATHRNQLVLNSNKQQG